MAQTASLPDYEQLSNQIKRTLPNANIAQIHGVLCGFVCATTGDINSGWQHALLGEKAHKKTQAILQQLYEISYHQLSEFSFEFSLLLPEDLADINVRAEALGLWCQGFLAGLKQAGVPIENRNPSEITDALNDIIEIANVTYGDIAENEDDETAYFELVEHVRLAVSMLFHELKSGENNLPEGV